MKNFILLFFGMHIVLRVFLGSVFAGAPNVDASASDALKQTIQMLTDPNLREKAMQESAQGKETHDAVMSLAGDEQNAQEMYELAAGIFQDLMTQSGGDPQKAMTELEKAKKDPAAFAAKLKPEHIKKLSAIAKKAKPKK